jgi:hypothetical protein
MFVAQIGSTLVFAQVLIVRHGDSFELRHVADRDSDSQLLKPLAVSALRQLAQFNQSGAFRPLRSAPDLQTGWRATPVNIADLGLALNHLYPGAVADWYAVRAGTPPVTHYRQYTNRQTGMYRVTQHLDDDQASATIRACCHPRFCLKQRLWTVEGLPADALEGKSLIPCLEPCAVLLEFARTIIRLEQAADRQLSDPETPVTTAESDATPMRVADFTAARNPRRLQYLVEKPGASNHSDRDRSPVAAATKTQTEELLSQ